MLPYKVQKVSLFVISFSFLMLLFLLLEKLDVLHFFAHSTTTLISFFSVLIYISILLAIVSSERKEDENTKNIRNKVASRVSLVFIILILCYKILEALFIEQDLSDVLPVSLLTSGKIILLFFIIYLVALKISIKRNHNKQE